METNIARTFAALSATNEAILYAKSPDELYRQVCEAAFSSGDFLATAIFLLEPETGKLRLVAGFGEDIKRLREIDISIVADTPEGSGVCGQAFRDGKICISNDFMNDPRSLAWRDGVREGRVGAAAALPLTCNGHSVGVLLVTRRPTGSLTERIVSLLERMAANISYALDNFDHEAARKNGERAMRRLNRMFGAISATNEAILRAKTAQELYQGVCDAAVNDGKSIASVILLEEPGSVWLKPVAGTGAIIEQVERERVSIDPDHIYGAGVCGVAFRTQQPCVNDDFLNSIQGKRWEKAGREAGVVACAAFPLIKAGKSVGVFVFLIGRSWAQDKEVIALLARIAENVSFALENLDHADEKARTEEQKERLSEMLEALSATNEAIMRVKTRARLFELVCEAAVLGGTFTSATIAMAEPGGEFLRIAATKGTNYERIRNWPFPVSAAIPEGRGLSGTSFRTRQPCIINDFLADPRTAPWHDLAKKDGTRSGASFPLLKNGDEAIGVLMFLSRHEGAFTDDLVGLLGRLAENVSFALDNFDRAEEKADRRAKRAGDANVCGAQRHQRSDHAGEIAKRVVRTGLRSCREGRPVHLDYRRFGQYRQRCVRHRGGGGADGGDLAKCQIVDQRRTPGGTRIDRRRVPFPDALHQQRLSCRRAAQQLSRQGASRRREIGRRLSVADPRPGGRCHALSRRRKGHLHGRIRGTAATAGPTTCRLRSRISTAPTKRPRRTSGSNTSLRMTA